MLEEALSRCGHRQAKDNQFVANFTSQLVTVGNFFGNHENTIYKVKVLDKEVNPINIKW